MGVPDLSLSGKPCDLRNEASEPVEFCVARAQRGCVSRDSIINRSSLTCNSYDQNTDTRKLHYTCYQAAEYLMWAALTHCIHLLSLYEPFSIESHDNGLTPLCPMASVRSVDGG